MLMLVQFQPNLVRTYPHTHSIRSTELNLGPDRTPGTKATTAPPPTITRMHKYTHERRVKVVHPPRLALPFLTQSHLF